MIHCPRCDALNPPSNATCVACDAPLAEGPTSSMTVVGSAVDDGTVEVLEQRQRRRSGNSAEKTQPTGRSPSRTASTSIPRRQRRSSLPRLPKPSRPQAAKRFSREVTPPSGNAIDDLESALSTNMPMDVDLSDVQSPVPDASPVPGHPDAPSYAVLRRPTRAPRRPAGPQKLPGGAPKLPKPRPGVHKGATVQGVRLGMRGLFENDGEAERSSLGVPTNDLSAFERLDTAMREEAVAPSGPVDDFPSSLPEPEVREDGPAAPLWSADESLLDEVSPFARQDTNSRTAIPLDDSYLDAAAATGETSPFTEPVVTDRSFNAPGQPEGDESWLDDEGDWGLGDAVAPTMPLDDKSPDDEDDELTIKFDEFDQSGAFASITEADAQVPEVDRSDVLPEDLGDDDLLDVPITIDDDASDDEDDDEVAFDEYDTSGLFASVPDPEEGGELEFDIDLDEPDEAPTEPFNLDDLDVDTEDTVEFDSVAVAPDPVEPKAEAAPPSPPSGPQKRARTVPSERKGIEPFPTSARQQRSSSEVKVVEEVKPPPPSGPSPSIQVDESAYVPSESSTAIPRPIAAAQPAPQAPKPQSPAEAPGGAVFSIVLVAFVVGIVVLMAYAFGLF